MNEKKKSINSYPLTEEAKTVLSKLADFEFWIENDALCEISRKCRFIDESIENMEKIVTEYPCPHNKGVLNILKSAKKDVDRLNESIYRDIMEITDIFIGFDDICNKEEFDDDDLTLVFKAQLPEVSEE